MRTLVFDFHGVIVEFATDDEICEKLVERDFSLFRLRDRQASVSPQIRVIVSRREPPYARIPPRSRPWIHTKGAAVYRCGRRRFLDSAGRVLVILDFKSELAEIYSLDRDLLHEQTYLMIMSRCLAGTLFGT